MPHAILEAQSQDTTASLGTLARKIKDVEKRLDLYKEIDAALNPTKSVIAVTRTILIWVIISMQIVIGGIIAYRLGPEGYNRGQAKDNWQFLCRQNKRFHPDFVCPPIAKE